ncbi:hypothetical protein, partial [Brooklawnia sp.]|uniref:hypothetical protein n=1 Tax=Brooklawnia sp. TaxID=2699740 RepID=UPI00311F9D24
ASVPGGSRAAGGNRWIQVEAPLAPDPEIWTEPAGVGADSQGQGTAGHDMSAPPRSLAPGPFPVAAAIKRFHDSAAVLFEGLAISPEPIVHTTSTHEKK